MTSQPFLFQLGIAAYFVLVALIMASSVNSDQVNVEKAPSHGTQMVILQPVNGHQAGYYK